MAITQKYEFFALSAQYPLANDLARAFHKTVNAVEIRRFSDSEINLVVPTLEPGVTAVVVHATSTPVNDTIMELLFLVHGLKARGAKRVIAVIPYCGYSRQCVADDGKPGHAEVVARALESAGVDAVVVVEPHSENLAHLFSVPFYSVKVHDLIAQQCEQMFADGHACCVVAPDKGAHERAHNVAQLLGVPLVQFEKERYGINKVRFMGVQGGCAGERALLIDDIIDTGSTACAVANQLRASGVQRVYGYFVHPVFSGDSLTRLQQGPFEKLCVSDTIALGHQAQGLVADGVIKTFSVVQALVDILKEIDNEKKCCESR